MTYSHRKFYRSRNGKILGICQGLADWRDIPVGMVRLIFIIICFVTAFAPCIIIYLIAGLIFPAEPRGYGNRGWHSENENRSDSFDRSKDWDKESDWDRRFHSKK